MENEVKEYYEAFLVKLDYFANKDVKLTLKLLQLMKNGIEKSIFALSHPAKNMQDFLENPFGNI